MIAHAGLIALRGAGGWLGALILGPSGVGKSDLALRALDQGFRLVADDRTRLFVSAGRLFGRAPEALKGLMEARGLGLIRVPQLDVAPVSLCVRCNMPGDPIERYPDPRREIFLGIEVPAIDLRPLESSAPAKIRRGLEILGAGSQGAYQA